MKYFLASPPRCPILGRVRPPLRFQYSCNRGNLPGSVCALSCSSHGHVLRNGNSPLVCRRDGNWNQNIRRISCGKIVVFYQSKGVAILLEFSI